MGLMKVEEQRRISQMPPPQKRGLSKRFVVTVIIILATLNLGAVGWFYFKMRASAESATTAAENATTFSSATTTTKLPNEDVAGQDLAGLERYKGAIRTFYEKDSNNSVIFEYKVNAPASLILNFYKSQLAGQNWILQNSKTDSASFIKEKAKIEIFTLENKSNKITTFKIIYTPAQ